MELESFGLGLGLVVLAWFLGHIVGAVINVLRRIV